MFCCAIHSVTTAVLARTIEVPKLLLQFAMKNLAKSIKAATKGLAALVLLTAVIGLGAQFYTDYTVFTTYLPSTMFRSNLHEVVPGRFYRSGEMNTLRLMEVVRANHIKTVIDLRLEPKDIEEGWANEAMTLQKENVQYIHVPLSSKRVPEAWHITSLLAAFDQSTEPILVHCSNGTHRTGFASFLWMVDKNNAAPKDAILQLSPTYGYIQLERDLKMLLGRKPTLDRVAFDFVKQSAIQPQSGSSIVFRDWYRGYIENLYPTPK